MLLNPPTFLPYFFVTSFKDGGVITDGPVSIQSDAYNLSAQLYEEEGSRNFPRMVSICLSDISDDRVSWWLKI